MSREHYLFWKGVSIMVIGMYPTLTLPSPCGEITAALTGIGAGLIVARLFGSEV